MSESWKDTLRKIVPLLGTALGGPIGGVATSLLSTALLGKADGSTTELATAITGGLNGDQILALKKAEQDFSAQMRALDIDVYKLEIEDRSSARDLFKINIWPQTGAAALYTIGFFVFLCWMLVLKRPDVPDWQQSALTLLLGALTAGQTQVLNWMFGSTMGSAAKTTALALSTPPK